MSVIGNGDGEAASLSYPAEFDIYILGISIISVLHEFYDCRVRVLNQVTPDSEYQPASRSYSMCACLTHFQTSLNFSAIFRAISTGAALPT